MKTVLVSTSAELAEAARRLEGAPRYFIDTEFDFGPGTKRLALIQVSTGGEEVFLVDTVRLSALEPLAKALGRSDCEWVLHAGKLDVELLSVALRLPAARSLFDTQVAWGLLGPEFPVSLGYLLFRVLGLRGAKAEQAGDWIRRPLSPEQIQYAAEDVAYLPKLRDHLDGRLRAKGLESIVLAASAEVCADEPGRTTTLEDFRNAWQLDGPGLAVLRHLIAQHNALPEKERGYALPPRCFLSIAKLIPETAEELGRIKGVPFAWVKRHGQSLVNALVRVSYEARKAEFTPLDPPPYATWPEILAEGWIRDAAARACAALEVSPDLVFPGQLVGLMARKVAAADGRKEAAVEALSGWRRELIGDRLVK